MRKRLLSGFFAAVMLLTSCGPTVPARREDDGVLTIVTTTYPIYLFANSLVSGVEGVAVERLDTGSTSCLHDYNLTVNDMKKIDRADVIAINGVGLEDFMEDALASSDAFIIDCSEGVELLENLSHHHDEHDHEGHHGHDHGHFDPHYWMDPRNAQIMVQNLAEALTEKLPGYGGSIAEMAAGMDTILSAADLFLREDMLGEGADHVTGLITFHDGFQYFAHAYGLPLLEAIEEEAGSEASAKEIVEITALVNEYNIPVIFTEVNGSDATANAIARETGCAVAQLSMLMDGQEETIEEYVNGMVANMDAIRHGFADDTVEGTA